MAESSESGADGDARRVRVPWYPTYHEVRQLLGVLPGHSRAEITGLQRTLAGLSGTPKDPADWKDPDSWIPKRLPDEEGHEVHRELAYAIWTQSGKSVNPRYTDGSWNLCQKYELLAEGSVGNLKLTDRGRDFMDHLFGDTEIYLDEQEGLRALLGIVAERGPARTGVLQEPWTEFLRRHSRFNSKSTIRDTLQRRLKNLLDRDLVSREGVSYTATDHARDYLERFPPPTPPLPTTKPGGFQKLTQSLRNDGLLFSQELVANYLLASRPNDSPF